MIIEKFKPINFYNYKKLTVLKVFIYDYIRLVSKSINNNVLIYSVL